jgi:DNA-binding transcriptional MerR regulator
MVAWIRMAQQCGFSLREIRELLPLIADPERHRTEFPELVERRRNGIRLKIRDLEERLEYLSRVADCPFFGQ